MNSYYDKVLNRKILHGKQLFIVDVQLKEAAGAYESDLVVQPTADDSKQPIVDSARVQKSITRVEFVREVYARCDAIRAIKLLRRTFQFEVPDSTELQKIIDAL